MNDPEFSDVVNPAKAQEMVDYIRMRYQRGRDALEAEPEMATKQFASNQNVPLQEIRRDKQFARLFSAEEVELVCQLRTPRGMPLQTGHVKKVLSIADRKERMRWLTKAAEEGWTADVLSKQITKAKGQTEAHGRSIKPPVSLEDGLEQLVREGELWLKRLTVLVELIDKKSGAEAPSRDVGVALERLLESISTKKERQRWRKQLGPRTQELGTVLDKMRGQSTSAIAQKLRSLSDPA
jgi:hypothetical protein